MTPILEPHVACGHEQFPIRQKTAVDRVRRGHLQALLRFLQNFAVLLNPHLTLPSLYKIKANAQRCRSGFSYCGLRNEIRVNTGQVTRPTRVKSTFESLIATHMRSKICGT
jgi:hypothetical protein